MEVDDVFSKSLIFVFREHDEDRVQQKYDGLPDSEDEMSSNKKFSPS